MKTLSILCVLQLFFLAFLVQKLIHVGDQLNQLETGAARTSAESPSQAPDENRICSARYAGLDEKKLRRIIRSELDVMTNAWLEATAEDPQPETAGDPVENARRLDAARQELTYYINLGAISDIEMQKFQTEISRLAPESRTLMLRELVRALNSGDLKGRL